MKTVAVSGYFDPVHKGHVRLFEEAAKLGEKLVVIINNDAQTLAKKGYVFMPAIDRAFIIERLACVDEVVISVDEDSTVCKTLESIHPDVFANGGDRFSHNTPESVVCERMSIEMAFGVGGEKIESSSRLVSEASNKKGANNVK